MNRSNEIEQGDSFYKNTHTASKEGNTVNDLIYEAD